MKWYYTILYIIVVVVSIEFGIWKWTILGITLFFLIKDWKKIKAAMWKLSGVYRDESNTKK